jgi:hypothetical protein
MLAAHLEEKKKERKRNIKKHTVGIMEPAV